MAPSRSPSSRFATSLLLAVVAAAAVRGPAAQSPSPSTTSGSCMTEIISLSSCLGYMSGNSSAPKPSCCAALSGVVSSNPRCLCMVLAGGAASLGVTINDTRALELPAACRVKTPPPSQCSTVGVPVPSPASSGTPALTSLTSAGVGSKATPAIAGQSSGGGVGKATSILIVVISVAVVLLRV